MAEFLLVLLIFGAVITLIGITKDNGKSPTKRETRNDKKSPAKGAATYRSPGNRATVDDIIIEPIQDSQDNQEKYTKMSDFDPQDILTLSNVITENGSLVEAIRFYREAIKEAPELASLHYWLGVTLYIQDDFSNAYNSFEEALRINKSMPNACYFVAVILVSNGDDNKAVDYFSEAIKYIESGMLEDDEYVCTCLTGTDETLNVTKADVYAEYGHTLARLNEFDDASKAYKNALKIDDLSTTPKYKNALLFHWDLAYSIYCAGDLEEACRVLKEAIGSNENQYLYKDRLYFSLASILDEEGKAKEAVESYEKAATYFKELEESSNLYSFLTNFEYAFACYMIDDHATAINYFDKAVEDDHEALVPLFWKGLSHIALDQLEIAREIYMKMLKIKEQVRGEGDLSSPEDETIEAFIESLSALIEYENNNLDAAIRHMKKAACYNYEYYDISLVINFRLGSWLLEKCQSKFNSSTYARNNSMMTELIWLSDFLLSKNGDKNAWEMRKESFDDFESSEDDFTLFYSKNIDKLKKEASNYLASPSPYLVLLGSIKESDTSTKDFKISMLNEALTCLEYCINQNFYLDGRVDILLKLGNLSFFLFEETASTEHLESSVRRFSQSIDFDPNDENIYSSLESILFENYSLENTKIHDKSLWILEKLCEDHPNNAKINIYLGSVYHKRGHLDKALQLFNQSYSTVENDAIFLEKLGDLYKEKGDSQLAMDFYKKALDIERQA